MKRLWVIGIVGVSALGACATTPPEEDWLAVRAKEMSNDTPGYPRTTDIPQRPEDVRTPEEWAAARAELDWVNRQLDMLAEEKRAQSAAND